jgi:hypothetical protein
MNETHPYAASRRTAQDEIYVRYWDVYQQRWRNAWTKQDVPANCYQALPEADRALIDALPREEN